MTYEKICAQCGAKFTSRRSNSNLCSKKCKRTYWVAYGKSAYEQRKTRYEVQGYYVYAWFQEGELLPVYVGKGLGGRAWRDGKKDLNVRVEIIRDRLTEHGAYLIEGILLNLFKKLGGCKLNVTLGYTGGQLSDDLEQSKLDEGE